MLFPRSHVTFAAILTLLMIATACAQPGVEVSRNNEFRTYLEGWKGRPFEDFQKATNWRSASDSVPAIGEGFRIVKYSTLRAGASTAGSTVTYQHVTQWSGWANNGTSRPLTTTTTGMNQPRVVPTSSQTVRTEKVKMATSPAGCKLTLWVDAKGMISSYQLKGSDCFQETFDRLTPQ